MPFFGQMCFRSPDKKNLPEMRCRFSGKCVFGFLAKKIARNTAPFFGQMCFRFPGKKICPKYGAVFRANALFCPKNGTVFRANLFSVSWQKNLPEMRHRFSGKCVFGFLTKKICPKYGTVFRANAFSVSWQKNLPEIRYRFSGKRIILPEKRYRFSGKCVFGFLAKKFARTTVSFFGQMCFRCADKKNLPEIRYLISGKFFARNTVCISATFKSHLARCDSNVAEKPD